MVMEFSWVRITQQSMIMLWVFREDKDYQKAKVLATVFLLDLRCVRDLISH